MADSPTLLALSERVEKAAAREQWEMLDEARSVLVGMGLLDFGVRARFNRFLDVEAYESAAMTLVPEGNDALVRRFPDGRGGAHVYPAMRATLPMLSAATPALALTAACLRALASTEVASSLLGKGGR